MSYKRIIVNKKTCEVYFVKGSLKTGNYSVGYGKITNSLGANETFEEKCRGTSWRYGIGTHLKITNRPEEDLPKFYSVHTNPDVWTGETPENLRSLFNDPLGFNVSGFEEFLEDYKYYMKNYY